MGGIEITVDARAVSRKFESLAEKDIPFLTAFALTKTVQQVVEAEKAEMNRVFEPRPTEWTLQSMRIERAEKTDDPITASVAFKEFGGGTPAWKYLTPEIEGGLRRHKSHELALQRAGVMQAGEFAVPGQGVPLDPYGNMPGALIEQILSQLQAAQRTAGYVANQTARSRQRRQAQGGPTYFLLRGKSAADGIYRRMGGSRQILPFLIFVHPPTYTPRFAAYEVARRAVNENFAKFFSIGFKQYAD